MLTVLAIITVSLLIKTALFFHPHSGEGKPPMYGDFEAQRHWMEITNHLPIQDWYRNTTDNDLQYWGLDYPPLTAYHSWLMGRIGPPSSFALHNSRGLEDPTTKRYMRLTVLMSDLVLYVPSAFCAVRCVGGPRDRHPMVIAFLLLSPLLLLIDYAHFQYNGVSIGLVLLSAAALVKDKWALGAGLCMASVLYKQMSLYYTPAVFFFVVGRAVQHAGFAKGIFVHVALCGFVVIGLTALCAAPWTMVGRGTDVIVRMFPVGRGLYEDKVSNVWCSLSPVLKLGSLFGPPQVLLVCVATTALSFLPSCVHVMRNPTPRAFLHCLVISSFSFFLFSYQVHEKSILIPVVPAALLVMYPSERYDALLQYLHLLLIATFSMFPLLRKDRLLGPYVVAMVTLTYLGLLVRRSASWTVGALFSLSVVGIMLLHGLEYGVSPPARYPDLHTVVQGAFCCGHFLIAQVGLNICQRREKPLSVKTSRKRD